ncbi:MAG: hypothetical protein J5552_03670 [Prevotella sp.]|nr:hypothetical protein [Prevotella sp.]
MKSKVSNNNPWLLALSHRSAVSRLLFLTLFLFTFVGGATSQTPPRRTSEGLTKDITGYGVGEGGWYLIAFPIGEEEVYPQDVENLLSDDYDLYSFDQSIIGEEWRNYKDEPFQLERGRGYLYANSNDITLTFIGNPYDGDGTVTLDYDDTVPFPGWNLVGNPFSETAYIDRDFYVMNDDGSEIMAEPQHGAIQPKEGIFVIADEDGETLTFSTEESSSRGTGLALNLSRGSVSPGSTTIDRVIVRFGEGRMLPKFQLNPNHTQVYIPMDGKDYAVVRSKGMGEMPVNFKADANGSYTLSLSAEGVSFDYLHLIDSKTGSDIDLLKTPSYTFEATTTDDASRFKIVFAQDENTKTNTLADVKHSPTRGGGGVPILPSHGEEGNQPAWDDGGDDNGDDEGDDQPTTYTLTVEPFENLELITFVNDEMKMESDGTIDVEEGAQVMLSIVANEGFVIETLMVNGENHAADIEEDFTYSFEMPDGDVIISATAAIAPEPRVLFDFEDEADNHQTARWSGYDGYNAGVVTTCRPVTADDGKVHSGDYAMAYDMDFSQLTYYEEYIYSLMCYNWDDIKEHGFTYDEDNVRQRGAEEDFVDITGAAGLGMWIYIPDEVDVRGLDVRYTIGGKKNHTSAYERITSAMGTLLPYRDGLGTDGWYYYYFDLSNYSDWVCLRLQNTKINNSITKNGKTSELYGDVMQLYIHASAWKDPDKQFKSFNSHVTLYIDDITVDYSPIGPDREAPVFADPTYAYAGASDAAFGNDNVTIPSNGVAFGVTVADNTTKANATGLDANSVIVKIDGNEVPSTFSNGKLSIDEIDLANGTHTVTFEAADNSGNASHLTKTFIVNGSADLNTIKVVARDTELTSAFVGSLYYIDIVATDISEVESVLTTLKVNNVNDWELDGIEAADGFTASASLESYDKGIVNITVTRTGDVSAAGEAVIASIPIRTWYPHNALGKNSTWIITTKKCVYPMDIQVFTKAGCVTFTDGTVGYFSSPVVQCDSEAMCEYGYMGVNKGNEGGTNVVTSWHEHNAEPLEDLPATCTKDGFSGRTFCEECNSVIDWGNTLPASGHYFLVDEATVVLNDERTAATGECVCQEEGCGATEAFETDEVSLYDLTPASYTAAGEEVYQVVVQICAEPVYVRVPLAAIPFILADNFDNSTIINDNNGKTIVVACLQDRTLYKNGDWNTLCLPFPLTISGSVLDGDNVDVRTLSSSSFNSATGELTLNFTDKGAVTELIAGKPYIIRWSKSNPSDPNLTDLENPMFTNVTISDATANVSTDYADFIGTTSPVVYDAGTAHKDVLFLGSGSTLYYPDGSEASTINACRAYFQLKNGLTMGNPLSRFVLNFGEGDATGITTIAYTDFTDKAGAWYDMSGRRLSIKPTRSGIYVNGGRKVVVP